MDAAVLGDGLLEVTRKPSGPFPEARWPGLAVLESARGVGILCEGSAQFPQSGREGFLEVSRGQQQFATQILCIHLHRIEILKLQPVEEHCDLYLWPQGRISFPLGESLAV